MKKNIKGLAYLRTSSSTNVGPDKDSDKRQLVAIQAYARRAGVEIVLPPFYDAAVSGADPIDSRRGFGAMLTFLASNPEVKTILVETASRFARDLIVQETGYQMLKQRGIDLIAVDSPDSFVSDTPTAILIRQILGAVSQFEKTMLVSKLKQARDRKIAATGKCGGRKSHQERNPQVVELAKQLRWINRRMQERRSFRDIATMLAEQGHVSRSGKLYGPSAIKSMLDN
jgi:DNA invertase Pin-like site-specific DNA recombinase